MTKPFFTIITACYNNGTTVRNTIESVLRQTFTDFEYIVVNDGCTDDTMDIVKSYDDPRIIIVDKENGGQASAINAGKRIAQGKYICFLDADDVFFPQAMENYAKIINDISKESGELIPAVFSGVFYDYTSDYSDSEKFAKYQQRVGEYKLFQNLAMPELFKFDNRFIIGKAAHRQQWAIRADLVPWSDEEICQIGNDNDFIFAAVDGMPVFAVSPFIGWGYSQFGLYNAPKNYEEKYKNIRSYVKRIQSKDYGPIGNLLRDVSVANNIDKLSKV